MNDYYYLYCIAAEKSDFILTGMDNLPVEVITYENLHIYVSKTSRISYKIDLKNLQDHESVIERLMNDFTVLPVSFSTIVKDEESIRVFLKEYYEELNRNLNKVEGKTEMGIKIFFKLDYEAQGRQDIHPDQSPKEYMEMHFKRYQERKKQMENISNMSEKVHNLLMQTATDTSCSRPFRNNLVLNAAYLINKQNIKWFLELVDEAKQLYPEFTIICSGPWPPYHFTQIKQVGDKNE